MWTDAQRDGRPVKYTWRSLRKRRSSIHTPRRKVWLTTAAGVPCSNAANIERKTWTRNLLKFAAVPQTPETISAVSGLKFTILYGQVEEVLLFNNFFRLSIRALIAKIIVRESCAMVPKWRFFCVLYFQQAAYSTFQTCILNSH